MKPKYPVPAQWKPNPADQHPTDPHNGEEPPTVPWFFYRTPRTTPRTLVGRIIFGSVAKVQTVFVEKALSKRQRRRMKGKKRG